MESRYFVRAGFRKSIESPVNRLMLCLIPCFTPPRNAFLIPSRAARLFSNGARSVLTLIFSALLPAALPACAAQAQGFNADARFPYSCIPDFSGTLAAPAGRNGFLTVSSDGHFVWPDGTRARFWGINVSSTRLDIPPRDIEEVVSNFARAGLNMVRLEAIDNRNCLLGKVDSRDSQRFDPHYLDRLDRWMDSLRRHGIYYYLDLLDFRTFKEADGVPSADALDRAARPYALYNPRLIQLQKEYATKLLTHRNPYSKLRIVDDPAFALVEICNEHGFFLYPEKLETLVEPYGSELVGLWNTWLSKRYPDRAALDAAWTVVGQPSLMPTEDPAQRTVALPILASGIMDKSGPEATAARRSPARARDGVEFLVELQRAYFRQMREHLRSIGVKVPVTAVVSSDVAADVASVAQECDFTAENWYGEGINGDLRTPDYRYYGNRNTVRADDTGGFAPYTGALRWNNKPVVVREWASTWPNQYRAVSEPEALAYSALQDFDAVLLFGYQTNRAPNGAEADALNDFAFQCDPTVWGLHALAGQAFLSGAIQPAKYAITLVYPTAKQFNWPNRLTDLRRAAYTSRINSILSDAGWGALSAVPTGQSKDLQSLRGVLTQLRALKTPANPESVSNGVWSSDTGQIVRYSRDGRLVVRTPRISLVCGDLAPDTVYDLGLFKVSTPTRFGALMAYAADGRPMRQSRHIVLKMVSRAVNTGEQYEPSPISSPGTWVLKAPGAGPVVTLGRPSSQPTRIWLNLNTAPRPAAKGATTPRRVAPKPDGPLLMLYMADGTWELEMKNGRAVVVCDTTGIAGNLLGRAFTTVRGPVELAFGAGGSPVARRHALPPLPPALCAPTVRGSAKTAGSGAQTAVAAAR